MQSCRLRRAAAFLGSWELCFAGVCESLGFASADQFRAALPQLAAKIDAAARDYSALTGTEYAFAYSTLASTPALKRQAALMEAVHTTEFARALEEWTGNDRVDLLSGGGAGGSGFMLPGGDFALPPGDSRERLADLDLRVAYRDRLLLPHAGCLPDIGAPECRVPATQCNHLYSADGDRAGATCGQGLDPRGVHAATCNVGGGLDAGHDAIRDWLHRLLTRWTGQVVLKEQRVPRWDRVRKVRGLPVMVQARGPDGQLRWNADGSRVLVEDWERARLDVSFTDADGRLTHIDVSVIAAATTQVAEIRHRGDASKPGRAAAQREDGKRRRYPPADNPSEPLVVWCSPSRAEAAWEKRRCYS